MNITKEKLKKKKISIQKLTSVNINSPHFPPFRSSIEGINLYPLWSQVTRILQKRVAIPRRIGKHCGIASIHNETNDRITGSEVYKLTLRTNLKGCVQQFIVGKFL